MLVKRLAGSSVWRCAALFAQMALAGVSMHEQFRVATERWVSVLGVTETVVMFVLAGGSMWWGAAVLLR